MSPKLVYVALKNKLLDFIETVSDTKNMQFDNKQNVSLQPANCFIFLNLH